MANTSKTPKLFVAVSPTAERVELAGGHPAVVAHSKSKLAIAVVLLAFWGYMVYYVSEHNSGAVAWILGLIVWAFIFAQCRNVAKAYRTVRRQPRAQAFEKAVSSGYIVEVDATIISAVALALPAGTKLTDKQWQELMQRGADKVRYLQTNVLPVLLPTSGALPFVRAEAQRQLKEGVNDIINGGDELDVQSNNVNYATGLGMNLDEVD